MKLNILRKHYRQSGNNWVPKKPFKTTEDIIDFLGTEPIPNSFYDCDTCPYMHLATHLPKNRNKVK